MTAGGVEWLAAGWGEARQVRGLGLTLTRPHERARVRVWVARGGDGWQAPPGAVTVATAGTRVDVRLYDTVADRVRVELLDEHERPLPMGLSESSSLEVDLGNEARDLSLAVRGRGPLWRRRRDLGPEHRAKIHHPNAGLLYAIAFAQGTGLYTIDPVAAVPSLGGTTGWG